MKISGIELFNFGPYEGTAMFDLRATSPEQRIVIIGGKNGAGKTTLFTAIKVCLYGHVAFGYKAAGKKYTNEVATLINNQAKLNDTESAYVRIAFSEERIDTDHYEVMRRWTWSSGSIEESFIVQKNGIQLGEDAIVDFNNYLFHLIPPALLNLYFFDGEEIADFFFGESGNNIKDAVLTLSGSDTFDILYNNIRKMLNGVESDSESVAQDYADQREVFNRLGQDKGVLERSIEQLTEERDQLEIELKSGKELYAASGGISLEEWKELQKELKDEESRRERLNWDLKQIAATMLPLLIVRDLLEEAKEQISDEQKAGTLSILRETLSDPKFEKFLRLRLGNISPSISETDVSKFREDIIAYFVHPGAESVDRLFSLSEDDTVSVLNTIAEAERFGGNTISKYRRRINKSIKDSREVRDRIQNSSIENHEAFVQKQASLQLAIDEKSMEINAKSSELTSLIEKIEIVKRDIATTRKALEDEIKKDSIASLSDRTLLLVEELQEIQYQKIIHEIERDINIKFRELLRKEGFIDRIRVDDDFSLHLIRNESIEYAKICELVAEQGARAVKRRLNSEAFTKLLELLSTDEDNLPFALNRWGEDYINLPVEQEIIQLSNGERQILVMALYWAIMRQSSSELPFIIDTPFARIDTEHRANITERFFKELPGQLFILSTNEELKKEHMAALEGQIIRIFTLDYSAERKTNVVEDAYFEVNNGI